MSITTFAIINKTPHTVNLFANDKVTQIQSWEPTQEARVDSVESEVIHPTGLPCVFHEWESADSKLPEFQEGVYYIVSTLFADRIRSRTKADLLIPDSGPSAIRENGKVKGVIRFTVPS